MTFSLIYNQMKYFRNLNIIWNDYLKCGSNDVFYKVARFVSLSLFVSDFGAVYLQSSTSHRGYKNLMAGENCLKAASCEPGLFVKTQVSEDIIVGIIKGEI